MAEQFISAAIQPVVGTFDAARMSTGEPGLPWQFRWRSQTIEIARVLRTWRETGPCRHGSGETYVRKHWFEVLTDSGDIMKIYFQAAVPIAKKQQSLVVVHDRLGGECNLTPTSFRQIVPHAGRSSAQERKR